MQTEVLGKPAATALIVLSLAAHVMCTFVLLQLVLSALYGDLPLTLT